MACRPSLENDGNLNPHPLALYSSVTLSDHLQSLSWRCDILFNGACGCVVGT